MGWMTTALSTPNTRSQTIFRRKTTQTPPWPESAVTARIRALYGEFSGRSDSGFLTLSGRLQTRWRGTTVCKNSTDLSELLRKRCSVIHVDFRQEALLLLVGIMHGEVGCLIRAQRGMRNPDHRARCPAAMAIAAEPGTLGWVPWSYAHPTPGRTTASSVR